MRSRLSIVESYKISSVKGGRRELREFLNGDGDLGLPPARVHALAVLRELAASRSLFHAPPATILIMRGVAQRREHRVRPEGRWFESCRAHGGLTSRALPGSESTRPNRKVDALKKAAWSDPVTFRLSPDISA